MAFISHRKHSLTNHRTQTNLRIKLNEIVYGTKKVVASSRTTSPMGKSASIQEKHNLGITYSKETQKNGLAVFNTKI